MPVQGTGGCRWGEGVLQCDVDGVVYFMLVVGVMWWVDGGCCIFCGVMWSFGVLDCVSVLVPVCSVGKSGGCVVNTSMGGVRGGSILVVVWCFWAGRRGVIGVGAGLLWGAKTC